MIIFNWWTHEIWCLILCTMTIMPKTYTPVNRTVFVFTYIRVVQGSYFNFHRTSKLFPLKCFFVFVLFSKFALSLLISVICCGHYWSNSSLLIWWKCIWITRLIHEILDMNFIPNQHDKNTLISTFRLIKKFICCAKLNLSKQVFSIQRSRLITCTRFV